MTTRKALLTILLSVILIVFPVIIVVWDKYFPTSHICIDTTHLSCDGNCKCDGLGCGEYIIHPKHCMCEFCIEATDSGTRNYTIKENKDSILIYNEDNQLVDHYLFNHNPKSFDYHLNVHYDTAWLYNNTGALVSIGHFDSIPELIIYDNQ